MTIDCYCDYDPPLVFSKRVVTARKLHTCFECGVEIRPGERYEYVFGRWDYGVDQFHTCERCYDVRMYVKNNVPCFCWYYGSAIDDAMETVKEAYWNARDEVRGLWFGFGRLMVKRNRFNRERRNEQGR